MNAFPSIVPSPHGRQTFDVPNTPGPVDVELEGRALRLTNLDRVLWPRTGTTKGDMIRYSASVASSLVPYVEGRPITMGRFPTGVDGPGWAQTECRGRPQWMATTPIQIRGGRIRNYCLVNDLPSLLWMANQGAIELHVFLWRVTSSEQPTELVLDLDPGIGTTWRDVSSAALLGREELERIGLTSWAKASGATGIHVHAPVDGATFTETKSTAREVARRLSAREPSLIIDRMRRSERTRRVFIDWGQNDPRRSMIAVYSLRAMPEPTSALPLRWRDLERAAT